MKTCGSKTISAYTYNCVKTNRIFTFNSEDKYKISLKYHRKKCDYCNNKKDEFLEKEMLINHKNINLAPTNELQKILRESV